MSHDLTQHAIIVDPFSSGRFLVQEMRARGIPSVAVLTNGIPALFAGAFRPEQYAAVLHLDGDIAPLLPALRAYRPVCVMVGLETGIATMDALAAALDLPGNDPATSALRRDKFTMQEAIRQAGLNAVAQCEVTDTGAAAAWLERHASYPVVVKPGQSAGSDNIHFCASKEEALEAVARVLGADNLFGTPNATVLVQEYLEGQEWVVDTVSCAGQCKPVNVTRYKKVRSNDGRLVYRHSAFLAPDQAQYGELIEYARQVVAVLGVEYGAAHVELIATARGPVLVEVNSRMHGGDAVRVLRDYVRFTQLELSVDAFVDAQAFRRKAQQDVSYSASVIAHFLISELSGRVTRVIDQQHLAGLSSFAGAHLPAVGDTLRVTDSLTSAPGYIWLANPSAASLDADQARLVDWEARGLLYAA